MYSISLLTLRKTVGVPPRRSEGARVFIRQVEILEGLTRVLLRSRNEEANPLLSQGLIVRKLSMLALSTMTFG